MPMYETIRVLAPAGRGMENRPSAPVVVEIFEPFTVTVAPGRTLPLSSWTVPVIVFVWGKAAERIKNTPIRHRSTRENTFFLI
jgi:hypothetical protein